MDYNEDAINHNRPSASEAQKRSGNVVVTMESFQRSQAEWLAARQLALLQPVEAPLPPLRPLPTSEFVWPVMSIEEFSARVDALRMNRSVEKRKERVTEPAGGFQSKKPSTLSAEQQRQIDESIETLRQDFKRVLSENVPEPLEPLPPVPTWLDEEIAEMADLNRRLDEANRRRKARLVEKRQDNVAEPAKPAELLESSQSGKPSTMSPERQQQVDDTVAQMRRDFERVLSERTPKPLEPLPPLPSRPSKRLREMADLTQQLDEVYRHRQEAGSPAGGVQSKKPSTLSVEHQRQMDEEMDALQRDIDRMLAEKAPKPLEPLPPLPTWPEERMREMADLTQQLDEANRRRQEQNRATRAGAGPSGDSAVKKEKKSPP